MSTRLTALAIERTKGGTLRREIADAGCPGLYLIVQVSGAKSWAIRTRIDGRQARSLSALTRASMLAAREQARHMLMLIDQGIDPRRKREEERQQQEDERREEAERVANTLRAVAEQFRDNSMRKTQARSWHDRWAALDRHVLRRLGDRPIESVRRRDIHAILDDLQDKPGARHHTRSAVSALFRWAVDREIIDANPVAAMPRPKIGVRERALTDGEIPVAWKVAGAIGYPFGSFVQLLMLTACRRGEIAGLRWPEIDLDKNTITIPLNATRLAGR